MGQPTAAPPRRRSLALACLAAAGVAFVALSAHPASGPAVGELLLYGGLTFKEIAEGLGHTGGTTAGVNTAKNGVEDAASAADVDDELYGRALEELVDDSTAAPTSAIDSWTVYFTATMDSDSIISTSYVWYITDENAAVSATVLIDSSGLACGVSVYNDTLIYFTDQDGGVWTIETSGLDATEIVSYDAYGLTGEPSGMDMWIYTGQIFWTDLTAGAVYSALFDGSGLALVSDNFTKPFDLSIAPHQGKLYVSDWELERLIRLNTEGGEWEEFLHVPTPRGVWCDQTSDRVFFASYNMSYIGAASMDVHSGDIDIILNGSFLYGPPVSVGIDYLRDLIFYTTESEIALYSMTTREYALIAYLTGLQFLWVEAYIEPTPAPTWVMTDTPTSAPTLVPYPAPTPSPSLLAEPGAQRPAVAGAVLRALGPPVPYPTPEPSAVPTPCPHPSPASRRRAVRDAVAGAGPSRPPRRPTRRPGRPRPAHGRPDGLAQRPPDDGDPSGTRRPALLRAGVPALGQPVLAPVVRADARALREPDAGASATPSYVPSPCRARADLPPSAAPSQMPTPWPTPMPSPIPTEYKEPSTIPTYSQKPSFAPSYTPTSAPTHHPSKPPTTAPTRVPTSQPSPIPTLPPTAVPTMEPTPAPSALPSSAPSTHPSSMPTPAPSPLPSVVPSPRPTSSLPSPAPSQSPTAYCDHLANMCGFCYCGGPTSLPSSSPTTARPTNLAFFAGAPTYRPTHLGDGVPEAQNRPSKHHVGN
ncbi:metalloendopeptidase [Aureococcus anophagefferens]|nr:metalloendopeptidase [Aureococcus anophagefferens]